MGHHGEETASVHQAQLRRWPEGMIINMSANHSKSFRTIAMYKNSLLSFNLVCSDLVTYYIAQHAPLDDSVDRKCVRDEQRSSLGCILYVQYVCMTFV